MVAKVLLKVLPCLTCL